MLKGHTPEQVPHWMQLCNCSPPGTLMTSLPKPLTRSASYLIVRCISIIRVSTESVQPPLSPAGRLTTFRRVWTSLTRIRSEYLNMRCQTLTIFCAAIGYFFRSEDHTSELQSLRH